MNEENNSVSQAAVIGVLATTAIVIFVISYLSNLFGLIKVLFVSHKTREDESETSDKYPKTQKEAIPIRSHKVHSEGRGKDLPAKVKFSHPWLAASLKAHTGDITGMNFSNNGKYLVSCADDRTIYLWFMKEYLNNASKFVRVNVEFDHATKICFSPDNKAFLATLYSGGVVRVFKMQRKQDGGVGKIETGFDFPEKDTEEILSFGIASNGGFVMTSHKKDTIINVWDIKGNLLEKFNSNLVSHTHCAVSPCGRFVACSGFTPEVKVWEVSFSKTGEFKEVTRAFQLGGHTSSVYSFSFNNDSTRVATVSKDGTWKLWDTNVDYKKHQDPRLLRTWSCDHLSGPSLIALSPNGLSVAIANSGHLYMYNVHQDDYDAILDVHSVGGASAIEFSPNNLVLATSGQKSIHLFQNVTGLQALIDDLHLKLKVTGNNAAMRDRINEQIASTKELLKKFNASNGSSKK